MKCEYCGNNVTGTTDWCPHCGANLDKWAQDFFKADYESLTRTDF